LSYLRAEHQDFLVNNISLSRLVDESIPWLVANGKLEKANKIMKDALKYNGKKVPIGSIFKESDELMKWNDSQKDKSLEYEEKSFKAKRRASFAIQNIMTETPGSEILAKEVGVADLFKSRIIRRYTFAGFYLQLVHIRII